MVVVLLSFVPASYASFITYTDRATWESAIGSFIVENFSGLTTGAIAPGTTSMNVVDFSYAGAHSGGGPNIEASGGPNGSQHFVGHIFKAANGGGVSRPGPHIFDFLGSTIGWGADFTSASTGAILTASFGTDLVNFSTEGVNNGFLGVISDTAFTSVSFGVGTGSSSAEFFRMDDLSFGSQVPTPTTLALFGLGLAGLGFVRREKA